jgi:hypothetical protein
MAQAPIARNVTFRIHGSMRIALSGSIFKRDLMPGWTAKHVIRNPASTSILATHVIRAIRVTIMGGAWIAILVDLTKVVEATDRMQGVIECDQASGM